jgi:hypothetical protein
MQELLVGGSGVLAALQWLQWLLLLMRRTSVVATVMGHETELGDRRGRCAIGEDLVFLERC